MAAVSVLLILLAGCGGSDVIDPLAQPLVDAAEAAGSPEIYAFSYIPVTASPFLSCLMGIEEVDGVLDVNAGAILLQPDRESPPIIVTETELLVADSESGSWMSSPWDASIDVETLTRIFGTTLAGFIVTGFRSPDLNMTALAGIGIADAVEPAATPLGAIGQSFEITMNPEQFSDELAASAPTAETADPTVTPPRLIVSIDDDGRVTAIVAKTDTEDANPDGNYVTTASYEDVQPILLPSPMLRVQRDLLDLDYPDPQVSCTFRN